MARNEPRTKVQRHCYSRDLHVQWRPWGGTGPYVQEPHPSTICTVDFVTYGANFPDWQKRLLVGDSATTTLQGTRYSSKASELRMDIRGKGAAKGFGRYAVGFNPEFAQFPGSPLSAADSIAEQQAASGFLKSYLQTTQKWAGGAAIAEFSEAIRFLANPIRSLYSHTFTFIKRVGQLKRVYKQDPVKYGKLLGQTWLTYAFGVSPIMSDVQSANAAVNNLADQLGAVDVQRIIGQGENRIFISRERKIAAYTSYAEYDVSTWLINQVKYLGAVRTKPPGIGLIAENFGVGFEDILPSVWEAIPWSWLVDYFVNVNEMLDSVRYLNADFAWVNRTVRNRAVRQTSACWAHIGPADAPYLEGVASGGQGYTQTAVVVRVPTTVPYPSWKFRCPGLPSQFANVAALILAIKGSKPRSGPL